MSGNFLKLNDAKNEVILVCPYVCGPGNTNYIHSSLGSLTLHLQKEA